MAESAVRPRTIGEEVIDCTKHVHVYGNVGDIFYYIVDYLSRGKLNQSP